LDQQTDPLQVCRNLFKLPFSVNFDDENPTTNATLNFPLESLGLPLLPAENISQLFSHGYTVLDHFVDDSLIKNALEMVRNGELIKASAIHTLEDDPFRDRSARDDFIKWFLSLIHPSLIESPLNTLLKTIIALRSQVSQIYHLHDDTAIPPSQPNPYTEYQLAHYPPAKPDAPSRYLKHRDGFPISDPTDDEQRRLTAICYVGDPEKPVVGGALRIHRDGGFDVEPIAGRVVLFLSGVVDHEVREAGSDRVALTAWWR
ncbi:hypothetical protein HK096_001366, partial [Nowakowskiella sp. JEL0078]